MTVREALNTASKTLRDAGCRDPEVDCELLLMHVLRFERHELYLSSRDSLAGEAEERFFSLVSGRSRRIPLQHLTGEAWFMGRRFESAPGALIPRQDTESMVEAFLRALPREPSLLLDVGTGSGIIAITLALAFPPCLVIGCDISMESLEIATRNAELHGASNLSLVRCDLLGPLIGAFDGIAANLPYIVSDVIASLEPEVRLHDPILSLDGGSDGMELIRRLLDEAPSRLGAGGILALEASGPQISILGQAINDTAGWAQVRSGVDLAGIPRWIVASRR